MTETPFRQGAILLHGSAAAIMAYGYNSLGTLDMDRWIKTQKGGHYQFLTIQGLAVAWLTMVLSLTGDLFPSFIVIKRVKRALLMVALPLAAVISSIYWTLILFLPELILQKDPNIEPSSPAAMYFIPVHIDMSLHAAPGLTLLADFIFLEEKFSKNEAQFVAPTIVILSSIWYGTWVEYCASFNGNFPYPFLTENPFEIRIGIYTGAATIALLSFWIINSLHSKSLPRSARLDITK